MWLKCEAANVMNFHFLALNEHCTTAVRAQNDEILKVALDGVALRLALAVFVLGRFFVLRFDMEFAGLKLYFFAFNPFTVVASNVCWGSCYVCWGGFLKCCMQFYSRVFDAWGFVIWNCTIHESRQSDEH